VDKKSLLILMMKNLRLIKIRIKFIARFFVLKVKKFEDLNLVFNFVYLKYLLRNLFIENPSLNID
jgi:hypothetical protein